MLRYALDIIALVLNMSDCLVHPYTSALTIHCALCSTKISDYRPAVHYWIPLHNNHLDHIKYEEDQTLLPNRHGNDSRVVSAP